MLSLSAGASSGTSMTRFGFCLSPAPSDSPRQIPISFRFLKGTTTREPATGTLSAAGSNAYVNVWKSGTGSATSTKPVGLEVIVPLAGASTCHLYSGFGRRANADPGAVCELDLTALHRHTFERI